MGTKGDKLTKPATAAAEALVPRLQPLGEVASRKMFGGYGIFCEDTMFAIVDSVGAAFLRVGESNQRDFEAAGSAPHAKMPYYQIPERVLGSDKELLGWARTALAVVSADKAK